MTFFEGLHRVIPGLIELLFDAIYNGKSDANHDDTDSAENVPEIAWQVIEENRHLRLGIMGR